MRAALELAAAGEPLNAETIAERQSIPPPFLKKILGELQRGRVVVSQRGRDGGHRLARARRRSRSPTCCARSRARSPTSAAGRPRRPSTQGSAARLQDVWIALRTNVREVLEQVTLADLVEDRLPEEIAALASRPDSWITR